jgi:hypothetical protein
MKLSSALSRRNFLIASAASATLAPRSIRASVSSHPEYLIVCMAKGGWDTTFALDPKPDSTLIDGPEADQTPDVLDIEYVRTFGEDLLIGCNDLKRMGVTTFFENWGHRTAVINGMWTGAITHDPCRVRLLTGTTNINKPDFATIFGAVRGQFEPLGSIDFSGISYPGPLAATTGRVGHRSQLRALLDPETFFQAPNGSTEALPLYRLETSEQEMIRDFIERRAERFGAAVADGGPNDQRMDDLFVSLDRRQRLIASGVDITGDLPLGDDPSFSSQATIGVDLLSKGLCRSVILRDHNTWDTHRVNVGQHDLHDRFFAVVNDMITDLDAKGLLDRTLVVVCSEMARTPKLNADRGKDHWGHTTQLLIGGGVTGGRRFGGTDELAESMRVNLATGELDPNGELLKYDSFVSGVLAHMDIDFEEWIPGAVPFTGATAS